MEQPTMKKSLSQCMTENRKQRLQEAEKRLYEVEDILLELPFSDPQFEKLAYERNNLLNII